VPDGLTASEHLRALTETGLARRWPQGAPVSIRGTIERELSLIAELRYEHFFLTVHDVVEYARRENILCQGRGSAANSAVCYALGITEIDPGRMQLLFERFISRERTDPIYLPQVRARARRAGGDGDLLSHPQRSARCRPRVGCRRPGHRPAHAAARMVG
jgi:hypothetical protein